MTGSADRRPPGSSLWHASALVVALGAAVRLVGELWTVSTGPRLPFWDMAKYAVSALRLGDALARWDLPEVLGTLNGMSVWPPFWPIVSAFGFAVVGPEPWVPRVLVGLAWGLGIVASVWALRPLPNGSTVGLLAAAWLAAGPLFQGLATVNLLEMPGLLLLILCLGAYLRAVESESVPGASAWWRVCAVFTVCLVFCKYNYGLLWIVPLALAEARRRVSSWTEFGRRLRATVRGLPWGRPGWWIPVTAVALLAAIRLTGGFELQVRGSSLSVTSIGNPAYALYLGLWIWALANRRRVGVFWRERLRREDRIFLRICRLPVALWMLIPPHVKELFGFLENRDSGLSVMESLLFYPRAVVELYAPTPWLGIGVLAAAFLSLRDLWGPSHGRRVVALCLWVSASALLVHPYKLDRFAAQTAWLAGAAAAMCLVPPWGRRERLRPGRSRLAEAVPAVLGGAVLAAAGWMGPDLEFAAERHRLWTVEEEVLPLVLDLMDPERRLDGGTLVIGTWNGLSPALLEQTARLEARRLDYGTAAPLPTTDFSRARRRPHRLVQALEAKEATWVAVVSVRGVPGFEEETAWTEPARSLLETSPSYRAVGEPETAGSYVWRWYRVH